MMLTKNTWIIVAATALVAMGLGATSAKAANVDYVGFAWEQGGLEFSLPGDQLSMATVVTQIDPQFEVDLNAAEATLYIEGLTSAGASVNPTTGGAVITYTGGTIAVYADPSFNHDWGINPANGTVPATFTDGDLVFSGEFTSFTVVLQASGAGIFEGYIDGTGGSALAGPCTGCAYTFSGTFAAPTGANIPEGYDLQIDGVLEIESTVPTENMNWGSLKQLFNPGR